MLEERQEKMKKMSEITLVQSWKAERSMTEIIIMKDDIEDNQDANYNIII